MLIFVLKCALFSIFTLFVCLFMRFHQKWWCLLKTFLSLWAKQRIVLLKHFWNPLFQFLALFCERIDAGATVIALICCWLLFSIHLSQNEITALSCEIYLKEKLFHFIPPFFVCKTFFFNVVFSLLLLLFCCYFCFHILPFFLRNLKLFFYRPDVPFFV